MSPYHPRSLLDRLGAFGSLLCAVHCAAIPLVIALAPSLGIAGWLGGTFEVAFVIFATGLGLFSVVWGYRRHGAVRALGLLLPGLATLWVAISYGPLHEAMLPQPAPRRRGEIETDRALAEAKLVDAETIADALTWLKPKERMVVLHDRALLNLTMRLKSVAQAGTQAAAEY